MTSRRQRTLGGKIALLLAALCSLAALFAYPRWTQRNAIRIGAVEDVVLLPWEVTIPARIDTGAATSALDARDIRPLPGRREVEFRLSERCGGYRVRRELRGWRSVTSSDGEAENRPLVLMEIRLGGRELRTEVTLTDRSRMKYPLLLGRRTLSGRWVVDVARTNLLSAESAGPPKL